MEISYNGNPFAVANYSLFEYEESNWLGITAVSSTYTTATFELYNRDSSPHTYILRNVAGTEHSYIVPAHQSRIVTLPNEVWNVLIAVYDINATEWNSSGSGSIRDGETFGDPAYAINGKLKIATATPAAIIPLTPYITSLTQNSLTSFTVNGVISGNPAQSVTVTYNFIYGTDPNNLNQSTALQQVTIPAGQDANVNATINGLTNDNLYYCKLAVNATQSDSKKIFLSPLPTANLKMHLRADLEVTSASNLVSNWGDVSGLGNNAVQTNGSNQPTVVENAINSKPIIRFNGTSSKMVLPASTTLGIQSNPYEMFIVAKSVSSDIQFLIAGGALEQFEYHLNGVGARFIPITSAYLDKGTAGDYTNGSAHVFSARASSSGGAVRVDGIDGGTSASNLLSSNSGNLLLGVRSDGAYYFNGDIAEVILYNTNLSASDRNTVEQYLASRYGITSGALPVELVSFTASVKNNLVELKWQTATEVHNAGFAVERKMVQGSGFTSQNNNHEPQTLNQAWIQAGFVDGSGTSNSPKEYSYTDTKLNAGRYEYRLKQIPFPSPLGRGEGVRVTLKVYDALGREAATLVNEVKKPGNYSVQWNASKNSSGIYFAKLQSETKFTL